jgi:hypothetical protein
MVCRTTSEIISSDGSSSGSATVPRGWEKTMSSPITFTVSR